MKTPPPPPRRSRRRRFVTLLILLSSSCDIVFGISLAADAQERSELKKSPSGESPENVMSRHFKFLSAPDNDVFFHAAVRRGNTADRREVTKRSPMSVGFVSGLGEEHPRILTHHVAVAKSGTATHVEERHGPNLLSLEGDDALLEHHPGPIVLHEIPVPLHEVAKAPAIAVVVPKVLPAEVKTVSVTHHPTAPIQPLILNPAATIVVVPHIDLTHPVTHISPSSSEDSLRDHVGGYGVGVNFGGAGAGHGYYAG